ncbi:hypothetical protein PI87_09855 [Ralstonia sp. A12]|uniref:serine hydrolase n=1 Tax=Ralstonia sp. A12 TaxID=1217052 RepID=UPI0005757B15|nr:hypothetical protein PI87_09855 [Ralstonia sp. A12]
MSASALLQRAEAPSALLHERIQRVVQQAIDAQRLVGAVVLVARGRLDLDEGVDRYLPDFRPRLADGRPEYITSRQLLSHTVALTDLQEVR